MFDLSGKVAVVTGGNGGIGLAMARGLASAGAKIVVAARNAEKSQAAVNELQKSGAAALAVTTDVTDAKSVQTMVDETVKRYGRLDILINNAGITLRGATHDLSAADWQKVLDTNVTGAFLCSKAAYPVMKKAGGGKVINIGSFLSNVALSFNPAYCTSKGAIVQLTRSTACAWAPDNIQVNAVLPGWVDTDMTRAARGVPGLTDYVLVRTPMKRVGQPDDLAGVAVFLASAASNFVTGAAIPVDGGLSAQA
ncbi:MAG: SDR family NAD(P)-dependent oxidoreductase [Sulfurifustaceae bacterium]